MKALDWFVGWFYWYTALCLLLLEAVEMPFGAAADVNNFINATHAPAPLVAFLLVASSLGLAVLYRLVRPFRS